MPIAYGLRGVMNVNDSSSAYSDQDTGRQPDRGAGQRRDLQQRDLAWSDAGQRSVEPLALRPERRELFLPDGDRPPAA